MEKEKKEQCFVMMPISDQGDYPKGHFDKIYEQIFQPAIEKAGYEPYRVDENKMCDSIMKKIFDAIYNSPMALCDLSNRNPNVLYELGLRQAYDKPVVLVQDDKTERIFDISGINTVYYKSNRLYENILEAREKITEAILSTKEGKETSIVKIWQAVAADVSHESMSEEDKVEIMLHRMMSDIQDLKMEKNVNQQIYNSVEHLYFNPYQESPEWLKFDLKPGVTNKEIKFVISRIRKEYDPNIECHITGKKLYVKFNTCRRDDITGCLIELRRLGEPCTEMPNLEL